LKKLKIIFPVLIVIVIISLLSSSILFKPDVLPWNLQQIEISGAWERTEGGNPNIIVAVIDGGIDFGHKDLNGVQWSNTDEIPDNNLDDDHNGYIDDIRALVAGIISAKRNSNGFVYGIAYKSKIMDIRVSNINGHVELSDELFVEAIFYAINNSANIINISLEI
jgi:subtilisin family serine protease